jgi:hypothetical protein
MLRNNSPNARSEIGTPHQQSDKSCGAGGNTNSRITPQYTLQKSIAADGRWARMKMTEQSRAKERANHAAK